MKKKRVISVLVATALTVSMIAGCGGGSEKTTEKKESTFKGSGEVNRFGWEKPEETLKIDVLDASGYYAPLEAQKEGEKNSLKYLKDEFNVEINVEHVSGDGKEALNLALASGDYPDVITYVPFSMVEKFAKMGKAVELTSYMDTVGTDIKKSMGEHYDLFLDDKEKLYYVPTMRGAITELPDRCAHIRYDEWKAIGSPEIKTPEDYYNALNAILEKFPKTPNGEDRYALSFYSDSGHYTDPVVLSGFWGLKSGYKIDDDGNFTHWAFTDEGKEMTKYFNQYHLDGTLDPDSFANNYEQWQTKFSNERVVGCVGEWWITYQSGHEIWQAEDPNLPEDKRFVQIGFKDEDAESANLSGKNFLGSYCTIITDKAEDPEAIMRFMNFQATDMGTALTGWGIPNGTPIGDTGEEVKFWNIDEEGNWEVDPEAKEQILAEKWSYDNAYYEEGMPWLFVNQSRWEDGVHDLWPNQMWYDENKWKSMMMENLDGTIYDSSALTLREKTDEQKIAEQSVTDAWKANWGDAVMADNDKEFEAAWKKLQDSLTSAGVDTLEQAMSDNYKKNMEKMETK